MTKICYALKNKEGSYLVLHIDGSHSFQPLNLNDLVYQCLLEDKDDVDFLMARIENLEIEVIKVTYEVMNG